VEAVTFSKAHRMARKPLRRAPRWFTWAVLLLGFVLGGVLDAVMLHHVVKQHHRRAIQVRPVREMRVEILPEEGAGALPAPRPQEYSRQALLAT
jgi:hypothetical protein